MSRDRAVTFAGGGSRTFYQLGLWSRWGAALEPRLAAVAACSAGACSATILFSGRVDETFAFWRIRRRHIERNLEWERLLAGRSPAPQYPVYRDTLLFAYENGGFDRIRALPFPLFVLVSRFPERVPAAVGTLLGLGAYLAERLARPGTVHATFGRAVGFRAMAVDARTCESPEALANLVLASSASPPITPVGRFGDERVLDGGFVDYAPAFLADAAPGVERNLVLLTRHETRPARVSVDARRRVYIAPSSKIPVRKWDYARPDLVDATFALGARDAAARQHDLDAFLESGGRRGSAPMKPMKKSA